MKLVYLCAFMLNNRAKRDSEKILEVLKIRANDVIADLGAGGGYYTFQFAKKVGVNGLVLAVDLNKGFLDYIEMKIKQKGIQNVVTIRGHRGGFSQPDRGCDLVFIRNVFHHFADAVSYFRNLKRNLNSQGRIAIIERRPSAKGIYVNRAGHFTPEEEIYQIMETAGFRHLETHLFLKQQSFNIFQVGGN